MVNITVTVTQGTYSVSEECNTNNIVSIDDCGYSHKVMNSYYDTRHFKEFYNKNIVATYCSYTMSCLKN